MPPACAWNGGEGCDVPSSISDEGEDAGVKPGCHNLTDFSFFCHWVSVSVDEFDKPIAREDMIGIAFFASSRKDALLPMPVLPMDAAMKKGFEELALPIVQRFSIAKDRLQATERDGVLSHVLRKHSDS